MALATLAPRWFCSSPLRTCGLCGSTGNFGAAAQSRQIDVGRGKRKSWNGLAGSGLSGFSGFSIFSRVFVLRSLVSRMARTRAKGKSRSKDLKVSKCHRCFEGTVFRCNHYSEALGLDACFSVYVPDAPRMQTTLPYPRDCEEFPVLLFLSDEGCSDIEILMQGGLLEHCASCGLILVSADTSPRSGTESGKDVFSGGGYYVNATEKPWDTHYRMREYLEGELLDFVHDNFPTCGTGAVSVMGHGMGGTGALSLALRKSDVAFRSVSALAPLLNPSMRTGWPQTAFRTLLGEDESAWRSYDPIALAMDSPKVAPPILLDMGSEGSSYVQDPVKPFDFLQACQQQGIPVDFRLRAGFDDSFFFVASVMEEHVDFHAKHLDDA